ncbi:MAG: ribonuclease E inhibitor RraB [Litoreibacter sp.]|uniref:ribonuclease E inhibitor RraB n=1 Tax=Litoreibacter sp. TaxID=1969459 RepID=UPI00329A4C07
MLLRLLTSLVKRFRKPVMIGSVQANKLVLDQIAERGDDGTLERHVRHLAYPMRGEVAAGMDRVMDLYAQAGFEVSETQYRNGVLGEHYAAVADDDFNTLTEGLRDDLERMGWEYDGWECAVLKAEEL